MTATSRRTMLLGMGATAALAACTSDSAGPDTSETTTTGPTSTMPGTAGPAAADPAPATARTPLVAADFDAVGTCAVLEPSTAGPFGLTEQFQRQDISEGYPGHPLRLGLRITDASCTARAGAEVEIWHCDATGDYSAFDDGGTGKDEAGDTTFLRGTQTSNADGIVDFDTIVPGWYPGRAVHIHITIRSADGDAQTGQLFFNEDFLAAAFAGPAYVANGSADTENSRDSVAATVAPDGLLQTEPADTIRGPGTLALLNLAI